MDGGYGRTAANLGIAHSQQAMLIGSGLMELLPETLQH